MKEKKLRKKIIALVEQYGKENFNNQTFVAGSSVVPASGKIVGSKEIALMTDAVLDGWLTTGRFNENFEKKLAQFLDIKYVLTTNSGSSANLLAFSALTSHLLGDRAIKRGDEVISVAAGFPTTVNPIIQFGAIPVFIDVDIPTYNINVELIEAAITSKTKAIMLAHTLGNPYNLKAIKNLCKKYSLWLIEDCCDALGSTYNDRLVGSFGDVATLSFYPAHHITMGEGGAVFTNNNMIKRAIESFRDWGRDCYCAPGQDNTCKRRFCRKMGKLPEGYDHKYTYSHVGYNLKITDMQAACGIAQLDKLKMFISIRKRNFDFLKKQLKKSQDFIILPEATENSDPSWFGFPITLKSTAPVTRVQILKYLNQQKIGTRLLFAGNITCQPYMHNQQYRIHGELKNTDVIMNNTFWVGIYPALGEQQLKYIAKQINMFLGTDF